MILYLLYLCFWIKVMCDFGFVKFGELVKNLFM